ncbi:DUF2267 domain-containing protein [Methanosarcina sp. KYL-1]|uniref:DUF2267 domain-containing protein n=1 Tax=Methanosarcina sp. KYL-1 TaxID=2602068 RepID=UPI0021018DD7|nr:DUF2267 domain-containing protein [Methanosarcina sp. KYL-1]MCQ1537367.1 DUF2267 domain-containing protein [Methanosarcina sp. KYL-1]
MKKKPDLYTLNPRYLLVSVISKPLLPLFSFLNFLLRYGYINTAHNLILSDDIDFFKIKGDVEITTGVTNLDKSIELTNAWLNEILDQLQWQSKKSAYQALRGTLHTLRDRLRIEEAVQLSTQLPLVIKGVYYDGWTLRDKPEKLHKEFTFRPPPKKSNLIFLFGHLSAHFFPSLQLIVQSSMIFR